MAVTELVLDTVTQQRLGQQVLSELAGCLYAVDCQTCGRPLGTEAPALAVDDLQVAAFAGLHHPACRQAGWNELSVINAREGANLSWVAHSGMLSLDHGGELDERPLLLVNPGLEMVILQRDDERRWQLGMELKFPHAGMRPFGPDFELERPIPGALARLTATSIAVTLQEPPYQTYEAPADARFLERARQIEGVLFAVSHARRPDRLTSQDELTQLLASRHTLGGFVALQGSSTAAAAAQSAPTAQKSGTVYVLHYNARHMTVGPVLARTDAQLKDRDAKSWAQQVIGAQAHLIAWSRIDDKRPDDGWFTLDAISVKHYLLRPHSDGWVLSEAFSRVDGHGADNDNEAKAWAAGALRHKAKLGALTWERGTSTRGSHALYTTW
jgi:hypothetical protein